MKKINPNFLFPFVALLVLILGLSTTMFTIPPLGKLMNPFIGVVQNGAELNFKEKELKIDELGLINTVSVYFDDRKVPHIYAENKHDLYFAQGYVTASLRLWQMDFTSYVSAGRLSEIFAEDAYLNYDRSQRRLGLLESAKNTLKLIEKDSVTINVLSSYTKGVNAYISSLDYARFPLEYKLLNYIPERWTNLKTVLILKQMGNSLTGYEEDLNMTNLILALGEEKYNKLFPNEHSYTSPIMNDLVGQINPSLSSIVKPDYLNYSFLSSKTTVKSSYNPKLGSNSWAVSGKKTKSGNPILCNDPHLNLTLPSIWVEMQLVCGDMNVYGVSIPGTPSIIIGFNKNIAWGITNGADDVKDWYKMKLKSDYSKYYFDGKWIQLDYKIEEIKRKEQQTFYDTIYYSVHGPIVFDKSFPNIGEGLAEHALKWELNSPSNEFSTFIKLNEAKNYSDYKEAIQSYKCPIQNFTFACKDNTIGINHQGNMAVKWESQGQFILDGTDKKHIPGSYIPSDSLPKMLKPKSEFVFSANQHPTGINYPYYYHGYYFESRANQIHKMLEKENRFDINKMQKMQLNNTNFFASEALPLLIKELLKNKLTKSQGKRVGEIQKWNYTYNIDDKCAKLFELWWSKLEENTWDEITNYSFYSTIPENYILLDILQKDPMNEYFDKENTTKKETANQIIYASFVEAVKEYQHLKKTSGVKWGDCNKIDIKHLTNRTAFSKIGMRSSGHPSAINAIANSWGPSWRMIVELGDRPKAYGIYIGGQSGNVGSKHYDDFISDWNYGKYYPLMFYMSREEAKRSTKNKWLMN